MKNNINTESGELSLLMCGASLFSPPFAGLTKGWIFVFLPWGGPQVCNPPLVAACVSISAGACCCCCYWSSSSYSSKQFSKLLASEADSESVSATRMSLITSSSSFIFFPTTAIDTYNDLPYLHSSAWLVCFRNLKWLRYEHLLPSKTMMWQLYEFQVFRGATKF